MHPRNVIRKIFEFCHQNSICIHSSFNTIHQECKGSENRHWHAPPFNWSKINVDASIITDTNIAGVSFVLRNHTGSFLEAMAFTIGARDIHQAEALAVLYALNWIASKNFIQIIIEEDNKSIMEAPSSGNLECVKWKDKSLLMECASVFGKLKDVQVMFIHRRENKVADTLAKYSRTHHSNSYWLSKPPSIIYELLLQDQKDMHLDN